MIVHKIKSKKKKKKNKISMSDFLIYVLLKNRNHIKGELPKNITQYLVTASETNKF